MEAFAESFPRPLWPSSTRFCLVLPTFAVRYHSPAHPPSPLWSDCLLPARVDGDGYEASGYSLSMEQVASPLIRGNINNFARPYLFPRRTYIAYAFFVLFFFSALFRCRFFFRTLSMVEDCRVVVYGVIAYF